MLNSETTITTVNFDQALQVIDDLKDVVRHDSDSSTIHHGLHPILGETIVVMGPMGPYTQITLGKSL